MSERKPTANELFETLGEQDDDEEAARVLSLSDEALDAELARGGFDPATERERGRMLGTPAIGGHPSPSGTPPPRRSMAPWWVNLLAASLGVLVLVGIGWGLLEPAEELRLGAGASWPERTAEPPKEVRRRALEDCDARRWASCLEGLDTAREGDPAGDADERVQRARSDAARALATAPATSDGRAPR